VPSARGGAKRLLRVALAATVEAGHRGRSFPPPHPRIVHGEPGRPWCAAGVPRPAGSGRDLQQAPRGATEARERDARAARLPHPALGHRQAGGLDSQLAQTAVHGHAVKRRVGDGHHTYLRIWQGWLCPAVVLDPFSRRVVGWAAGPTIHRALVLNAVVAASVSPLGRPFEAGLGRGGVALRQSQERAHQEAHLPEPRVGPCGYLLVHRKRLQPEPATRPSRGRPGRAITTPSAAVFSRAWELQVSITRRTPPTPRSCVTRSTRSRRPVIAWVVIERVS
jgi:hypothetical protein